MAKETLKIVIVGHVDHGKSTLIGRLLLDTNSLPKEKITEIKKISKELGKDTELAYLADQFKEEREKNITIDTTQIFFKTRKKNFVIIDAPGHVKFLKNMITGAAQAEAAVLIVDVNEGVMEQTRRHAYLLGMLGIDKTIVVFNKMDCINYEENRFSKIKDELLIFISHIGIKPFFTIPISAKEGENISKNSSRMSWYKGLPLLNALDSLKIEERNEEKPLRFPVQDIYEIDGKKIIVGRVESGHIMRHQKVILLPSMKETKIESIEIFASYKINAQAGESIGIILSDSSTVKRGDVIVQKGDFPKLVGTFRGNIFWMADEPLRINEEIVLRCATQEVKCVAKKIEKRINSSTLEIIEENAKELKSTEAGTVIFKLDQTIVAEKFSFIEELGRFVVEREYNLKGAGIITEL